MLAVEEFHPLRRRKASARYVRCARNSRRTSPFAAVGDRCFTCKVSLSGVTRPPAMQAGGTGCRTQFVSAEAASPPAATALGALPRLLALPPPMKACGQTVA